jgi:ankyrin repeat protein
VQFGHTVLHSAALDGAPNELIQVLIDAGADIKAKNNEGKTPADIAREQGNLLVAEFLDSFLPQVKSANMAV